MPQYGELTYLVSVKGKKKLLRIKENEDWQTQHGLVRMEDIVNTPFGGEVKSSLGVPFRVERVELFDLIMGIKRQTQIMYPKDMGLICMKLGVGNGRTILEAGSGSGGLTIALSWFSGEKELCTVLKRVRNFINLPKKTWHGRVSVTMCISTTGILPTVSVSMIMKF